MPEEPKPMTREDAELSEKARLLVVRAQRKYVLDRAASLRNQAAAKIKSAEQFERQAELLGSAGG